MEKITSPKQDQLQQNLLQSLVNEVIDNSNVVVSNVSTEITPSLLPTTLDPSDFLPTTVDISDNKLTSNMLVNHKETLSEVKSYNEEDENMLCNKNILGKNTLMYNEVVADSKVKADNTPPNTKVDKLSSVSNGKETLFKDFDNLLEKFKKFKEANPMIKTEDDPSRPNLKLRQVTHTNNVKPFNDVQPFGYIFADNLSDSRNELMHPFNKIKVHKTYDENRTYLVFNDGFRSNLQICVFKTKYGKHVYVNDIVVPLSVFLSISHCSVDKLPKGTTENLEHLDFTTDLNRIKCETYSGETFVIKNTTVPHIMAALQDLNELEKYESSNYFFNMLPTNIRMWSVIGYLYLVAMFSRLCPTRSPTRR